MMLAIGVKPRAGGDSMGNEDCVPLSALGMPDETEQMQSPEEGDPVQYTVEGTISRIEGDNAYVTRTAINGQPVAQKPDDQNQPENPAAEPDEDDQGYNQLADMANNTTLQ